jgi:gamma-glutamylcyclotransferase (GGCT)/AIG2-like uncharacterized protein YtfP
MSDEHVRLFVYGTLMPGYGNYRQIERHVHHAQPGIISGVLVDLGAYPALVPGDGFAEGVLLEIDAAALAITDRIECSYADRDRSLYAREEVVVEMGDGETVTAWTYEWARPDQLIDHPRLVVGDRDGVAVHAWQPRC